MFDNIEVEILFVRCMYSISPSLHYEKSVAQY